MLKTFFVNLTGAWCGLFCRFTTRKCFEMSVAVVLVVILFISTGLLGKQDFFLFFFPDAYVEIRQIDGVSVV